MSIGTIAGVFCVKSKTMQDMTDGPVGIWYNFYDEFSGCFIAAGRGKITKIEENGMTEKRNKNVWYMFRGLCVAPLVGFCLELGAVKAEAAVCLSGRWRRS